MRPQAAGSAPGPHEPSAGRRRPRPERRPGRRGLSEAPAPPAASTAARARALPEATLGSTPTRRRRVAPGQPGPAPAAARKPPAAALPLRPQWTVPGAPTRIAASLSRARDGLAGPHHSGRGWQGRSFRTRFVPSRPEEPGQNVTPRFAARSGPVGPYHRG